MELLTVHRPAAMRGEVSSISPSSKFAREVEERGISLADFGRSTAEEVIILTRTSREPLHLWQSNSSSSAFRERVNYRDTAETDRYRAEVRQINAGLRAADIGFLDDGFGIVDVADRRLRRHFITRDDDEPRFDKAGRLFGGFWLKLQSSRRRGLRIEGEPVADLDYSAMFTRLAYARLGATPPAGDLYDIPELRGYRSGVKMAMNCSLFDKGKRRRNWPEEMGVGVGDDEAARLPGSRAGEFEARLPEGWTVKRTRAAILNRHPDLKAAWGNQLGYDLMFTESRILIAVLLELLFRKIIALPMHDGLLVAASKAEVVAEVMKATAQEITGIDMPVARKDVPLTSSKGVLELG